MKNKEKLSGRKPLIQDEILDSINLPVIVLDRKFKNIQFNKSAFEEFDKPASPDAFNELLQNENSKKLLSVCRKAIESGKEKYLNLTVRKKTWGVRVYPSKTGVTLLFDIAKPSSWHDENLRNRMVLESMGDSFLLVDKDLNIIDVNKSICQSLGISRKRMLSMNVEDLNHPMPVSEIKKFHKKAEKRNIIFDTISQNKNGKREDIEVNMFLLKMGNKKLYGTLGRNVTEFKEVQNELIKSNERFKLISNATQDALWEINVVTGERWANEIHQRLYGLTNHDPVPLSKEWEKRIDPTMRNKIITGLDLAIARKESHWNAEYWFKISQKTWIYIYDRTLLFYDKDGNPEKMMGSMVDVTELKNIEEELTTQRNLSEGIINALPGIFYLIDKNGQFLRWNKNFETVTGYNSEEISKMTPADFFSKKEVDQLSSVIKEVFQKGSAQMEGVLLSKSGESKPYFLSGWKTLINEQECLIGTGIDMSEIKKAQESVKLMEIKITEQKIQEQKLISRAIISAQERERNHIAKELHDNVNQLLAGARLYLTMGAKKSTDFAEMLKYPLELLDNGIQEIRSLTHHHISPAKDVDLKELIEGIAELFKTVSINCQIEYKPDFKISENLLVNIYRILQEEASNILKHAQAKNVSFSIYSKDCNIYIITSDDGKGFDIEKQRDGIGLLNIFNRVESYNGTIRISTNPGQGCTLKIKIPIPDCDNTSQQKSKINKTQKSY